MNKNGEKENETNRELLETMEKRMMRGVKI